MFFRFSDKKFVKKADSDGTRGCIAAHQGSKNKTLDLNLPSLWSVLRAENRSIKLVAHKGTIGTTYLQHCIVDEYEFFLTGANGRGQRYFLQKIAGTDDLQVVELVTPDYSNMR